MGSEFLFTVEGVVKSADNGFLNLRPAESLAGLRERRQIEPFRIASPFAEVNVKYFGPLVPIGHVDEKYVVETAFAQKLGGKLRDVVGGGDHENRRLLFR